MSPHYRKQAVRNQRYLAIHGSNQQPGTRLPAAALDQQVSEEWSFAQTLRHLVFITDAWASRTVLDEEMRCCPPRSRDFADPLTGPSLIRASSPPGNCGWARRHPAAHSS